MFLQLRCVCIYDRISTPHYAHVDGQSLLSCPVFPQITRCPALFSRIFFPAFYTLALPHPALPHSRLLPTPLTKTKFFFAFILHLNAKNIVYHTS